MAGFGRRKGDLKLIAALAGGATVLAAAQHAGISERTAHRRLANPEFRQRIQSARSEILGQVFGRMADASTKAVDTLEELLTEAVSESVRLGAARTILEQTERLRQSVDFETRLRELESR